MDRRVPIPKLKPDFTGWDFNTYNTLTMGIMKTKYMIAVTGLVCFLSLLFTLTQEHKSDPCIFAVTAPHMGVPSFLRSFNALSFTKPCL